MFLTCGISSNTQEGLGFHSMWGYSPAVDVLDVIDVYDKSSHDDKELSSGDNNKPINILLIKCGDIRHIIKTLSQRFRHKTRRPLHVRTMSLFCAFFCFLGSAIE